MESLPGSNYNLGRILTDGATSRYPTSLYIVFDIWQQKLCQYTIRKQAAN